MLFGFPFMLLLRLKGCADKTVRRFPYFQKMRRPLLNHQSKRAVGHKNPFITQSKQGFE